MALQRGHENDVLLCMDAKGRKKWAIVVVYSSSKLSMHVTRRLHFVYKRTCHKRTLVLVMINRNQ